MSRDHVARHAVHGVENVLLMTSALHRTRRFGLVDLAIVVALAGLLFGVLQLGREWSGAARPAIVIDLSPWALPRYTFYSLSRGLLAYVLSLAFTLTYGYWAAKDRLAERVLVPLLDILQSIPVLGFMPGLILALVALFPHSNIGLELAAVIMIFTGQAWNMTFSYYHSLRSVPDDLSAVGAVYRFSWWQRLKWLELPYATLGLLWHSMLSMAGGWFFLMINGAFRLGDRDFRLPGIGSYMSVAVDQGRTDAMLYAIGAMTLMIVAVDQVLWRPVVVWAQKFRVEEGGTQERMTSWFLNWLRRSRLIVTLRRLWALPAGIAIGLSPRLSRLLQPVVQIVASFPAPMLFPIVIAGLAAAGVSLGWGSIVLMLLGTQWYILFNVIAGAMAIPTDLQEAARSYRLKGWRRFRALYLPGVFPYLVTGWVTAAGGAWNASIVAEYVTFKGQTLQAHGLGAQISAAAAAADFPRLAASILVMSAIVVAFNRTVWRYFYRLAEQRFSLNK